MDSSALAADAGKVAMGLRGGGDDVADDDEGGRRSRGAADAGFAASYTTAQP